jgi:magnesium-transporting ATPase (P-type)
VNTDFYGDSAETLNMRQHYTIIYNTFVMMTLANQISCRKLGWYDIRLHDHITNNHWFYLIVGGELGVQALIIEFPPFREIFGTTHLEWSMHYTCWVFGLGAIAVNLLAKKIF